MGLKYADQTWMEKLKEIKDLWLPSKAIKGGKRIPELLLVEEELFCEFYEYWIEPCINFKIFQTGAISIEKEAEIRSLFFAGAKEEQYPDFIELFCENMKKPVACPICKGERISYIQEAIKKDMNDMPEHMKLRVLVVCVLANEIPKDVFEKGTGWMNMIEGAVNHEVYENEYMDVEDDMQFAMEFRLNEEGKSQLFSKVLRNNSQKACEIMVQYEEILYTIQLHPYSMLHCVFADAECRKLTCVKGNIYFQDAANAVIQRGQQEGAKLSAYNKRNGIFDLWDPGTFLDISIDGKGGILILTAQELYSSMGMSRKENLPIRCYGSGKQWAWLHADGRLESNLENGKELTHVTAVVEDAERGLLVCNDTGCWDYRGAARKKIEASAFAALMFERFSNAQSLEQCECVKSRYVELSIKKNGEVEAVKV